MKYFEIEDIPFKEVETATGYKSVRIDVDKDGNVFEREPNQAERRLLSAPILRNEISFSIAAVLAKDPMYSW